MKIGIVGAGISGLAIAFAAERAGHDVTIFESESDVGGRMSSIRFGPYIIDIGFHVLHTAYPSLHRWIDFSKLEFKAMDDRPLDRMADRTDSFFLKTVRFPHLLKEISPNSRVHATVRMAA